MTTRPANHDTKQDEKSKFSFKDTGLSGLNLSDFNKAQAAELGKNLANEATVFIKNNPWAAVAGAALLGYLVGSMRGSRK